LSLAAAGTAQPPIPAPYKRPALVLGRALHAPWTEGTRVINRNFARVASSRRPVRVLSVTDERLCALTSSASNDEFSVEHVFTRSGYGSRAMQLAVPRVVGRLAASSLGQASVAHLFGVPLSLAPWLRRRGVRVVVHVMAISLRRGDRLLVQASMTLFRRWVDVFALSSPALLAPMAARGIHSSKLLIVPPAIDEQVFRPGDALAARRELGLDPGESLVVYLGRLSPQRFPAEMIAAALTQAASRAARPIRFLALSPDRTFDGSENTTQYLLECTRLAKHQLQNLPGVAVDVRAGSLDEETKIRLFRASDAVLFPFLATEAVEPPISLIEAMACGANVVVTPAANRSRLIRSGCNGYVSESAAELSGCLSRVLAIARGTTPLGSNARRAVLERHGFAAVGEATARVWEFVEAAPAAGRVR
jgi:glycosyltransferase involved in cell wall biosynthesis